MSTTNHAPLILLDSDVVRHFISGGKIDMLTSIYPGRFAMLDKVRDELCRSKQLKSIIENFIIRSNLLVVSFPSEMNIVMEYAYLRREFGEGESACLAVARYHGDLLQAVILKILEHIA
jgi:predicted nucleic acid-binding protein